MTSDIFDHLDQIATTIPAQQWMLVGGLMVNARAQATGIAHMGLGTLTG